jgi:hypothetical protein
MYKQQRQQLKNKAVVATPPSPSVAYKPKPDYRKTSSKRTSLKPSAPPPLELPDPTLLECIRYRYHYGVNVGSIYVVERWLTESAFPPNTPAGQSSELAAVTANANTFGLDATQKAFEARWSGCIKDADWDWLCNKAHCKLPLFHSLIHY